MSVDTVGIVMTKEKDPFKIWEIIKTALFQEMKIETGVNDVRAVWKDGFTMPSCEISDFAQLLTVSFEFAGEKRYMSVHLDCNSDYSDYRKGKKIIITLGAWGQSIRLIECVLHGLSKFGKAHILESDATEKWRAL